MLDIAIIGAGPAGWSAAITARMRDMNCAVLTAGDHTGWLYKAAKVENYPGLPAVKGAELLRLFAEQALSLGAGKQLGVVRQIQPMGQSFMILCGNDVFESRAVILSMGAARPKLLPGEEALVGQGVSYCGTCDAMFYRGRRVAVLSARESGAEEAEFLTRFASQVDFYFLRAHALPDAPGFTVVQEKPLSLSREGEQIRVATDRGAHDYDGVFIFRPAVTLEQLLPGLKQEKGFIVVDRRMATNLPLVYAAGDCTGQPLQIAKAVGEGNVAAISAAEDLQRSANGRG